MLEAAPALGRGFPRCPQAVRSSEENSSLLRVLRITSCVWPVTSKAYHLRLLAFDNCQTMMTFPSHSIHPRQNLKCRFSIAEAILQRWSELAVKCWPCHKEELKKGRDYQKENCKSCHHEFVRTIVIEQLNPILQTIASLKCFLSFKFLMSDKSTPQRFSRIVWRALGGIFEVLKQNWQTGSCLTLSGNLLPVHTINIVEGRPK